LLQMNSRCAGCIEVCQTRLFAMAATPVAHLIVTIRCSCIERFDPIGLPFIQTIFWKTGLQSLYLESAGAVNMDCRTQRCRTGAANVIIPATFDSIGVRFPCL